MEVKMLPPSAWRQGPADQARFSTLGSPLVLHRYIREGQGGCCLQRCRPSALGPVSLAQHAQPEPLLCGPAAVSTSQ